MHNNYTLDVRLLKKIIFPSEDRYISIPIIIKTKY